MYYRDVVLVKIDGGGINGNCHGFAKEDWDACVNQSIDEDEHLSRNGGEASGSGAARRRGRRGRQRPFPGNGDEYWISGPKADGSDRHFGGRMPVIHIDEDVREEYWVRIRNMPQHINNKSC